MRCVICGLEGGKKPKKLPEGYPICNRCVLRMIALLQEKYKPTGKQ